MRDLSKNKLHRLRTFSDLLLFTQQHSVVVIKTGHSSVPNFSDALLELFEKQWKEDTSFAWLDVSRVDFSSTDARITMRSWMSQMGMQYRRRIPPGYYLFQNGKALGYHHGTIDPHVQTLFSLVGGIGGLLVGLAYKDVSQGAEVFMRVFEMGQAANVYGFFSKRISAEGKRTSTRQNQKQQQDVYSDELSKAYKLMGISRTSTLVQIRKARLILLKTFHPDKNKDNFARFNRMTQDINQAYELIINSLESGT